MAIADAGMTAVFNVEWSNIATRLMEAIRDRVDSHCLPDIVTSEVDIRNIILFGYSQFRYLNLQGVVELQFAMQAFVSDITWESRFDTTIRVEISTEGFGSGNSGIRVTATYEGFRFPREFFENQAGDVDEARHTAVQDALDAAVRQAMEPVLAEFEYEVDFSSQFPNSASFAAPPPWKASWSILSFGLAADNDDDIDETKFLEDYSGTVGIDRSWSLTLDSTTYKSLIDEEFGTLDFTQAIDGWNGLVSLDFFHEDEDWSGINSFGHANYIRRHLGDHDIWFVAVGRSPSITGEVETYVIGYADFDINESSEQVELAVGFHAAGWWVTPLPVPTATPTITVFPTTVATKETDRPLRITGISPDNGTLFMNGIDSWLPSSTHFEFPESLNVDFFARRRIPGTCRYSGEHGEIRDDGAVVSRFEIRRVESIPPDPDVVATKWIFSIDLEDPDDVFAIELPSDLPRKIDLNEAVQVVVTMTVPDDDESTHQGQLIIKSTDGMHYVQLSGVRSLDEAIEERVAGVCIEEIELLPPAEWVRELDGLFADMESVLGGPPARDDYAELAIGGLPEDALILVHDRSGGLVSQSSRLGALHYLFVPLGTDHGLEFRVEDAAKWKQRGEALLHVSRTSEVGVLRIRDHITGLNADRSFLHLLAGDGAVVVDMGDPTVPREIAKVPLESPREIYSGEGSLYASTEKGVAIVDVNDPHNPKLHHEIPTPQPPAIRLFQDVLVVLAEGVLCIYRLKYSGLPVWSHEFRPREEVVAVQRVGPEYAIIGPGGGYRVRSLSQRDLAAARFAPLSRFPRWLQRLATGDQQRPQPTLVHHRQLILELNVDNGQGSEIRLLQRPPKGLLMHRETIQKHLRPRRIPG